jgi:hypothetical protein
MRPRSDGKVFCEKRGLRRARRIRRPARCVFDGGSMVLEVALRDISPVGARIAGPGLAGLPKTFELQIPDSVGGYSARLALLVWSKEAAAGLRFIDES